MTQGQHAEVLRKMGAPIQEIVLTPVPEELEYLKTYWLQCRRGQVLTYQELFYFQQVLQLALQPWESSVILRIDNLYWNLTNGDNRNTNSKG